MKITAQRASIAVAAAAMLLLLGAAPAEAAVTGQVNLVSHTPADPTTTPGVSSSGSVISSDGGFVAFRSKATDLVAGQTDANGADDIFLYERATGEMSLVSRTPGSPTTTANNESLVDAVTADGTIVLFRSAATNLVAGQSDHNGELDLFLYDRATGTTSLVSHATTGASSAGNGRTGFSVIDARGGRVAFGSTATNLVAGQSDANGTLDVFLYDAVAGTSTLVSHTPAGTTTTGNGLSDSPDISDTGAVITFESSATNIVTAQNDANSAVDVFAYQAASGAVTLVSHTPAGPTTTGNAAGVVPELNANGTFVAFFSGATNLVAAQSDTNSARDVFLTDLSTGTVSLVSHSAVGATTTPNGTSTDASISADGGFVAFQSAGNDVVGGSDTNAGSDIFLYERATGAVTLISNSGGATTAANGASEAPAISENGAFVAFRSTATNLSPDQDDTNGSADVFLHDRTGGSMRIVSHLPHDPDETASGASFEPSVSSDGDFVLFESSATNLVAAQSDSNGVRDVFLFRVPPEAPPADFDGDGDTDVSVFRPSNGFWFVSGGATTQFGTNGDIPVAADYDGNGTTDIAVFRPSSGVWFVKGGPIVQFGTDGDIPVPADYDGNGSHDVAVFRPSNGTWFVRGGTTLGWGSAGDIPVPADYNGDGRAEIAVFRPSVGTWFVHEQSPKSWGTAGDIPVPADTNGDGTAELIVFRPSAGFWYNFADWTFKFGTAGDMPMRADRDGDGYFDVTLFRPSSGTWFSDGTPAMSFGTAGDVPAPLPPAILTAFFMT